MEMAQLNRKVLQLNTGMEMAQLNRKVLQTWWKQSGLRMVAALSDGSLQVWDDSTQHVAGDRSGLTLTAHWDADVGGLPRVAWAPPEYGDVIASCSAKGAILLWEEVSLSGGCKDKKWRLISSIDHACALVLDMQFGNSYSGLKLVVLFADGYARVFEMLDTLNLNQWQLQAEFRNSRTLVDNTSKDLLQGASVSWRNATFGSHQPAFVFGCNSALASLNHAKVWEFEQSHQRWFCVAELREENEEAEPINHVSWAPNIGRSNETIAVASASGVCIWQVKFGPTNHDRQVSVERVARLTDFEEEVWQVEWDITGMTLATAGSGGVKLWQANLEGQWQQSAKV